jgi:hypothetical protein
MNLAVRTGSPVRGTSTTSTMPRPVVIRRGGLRA